MIKGWDVGVATMKKGEVSRLICRSDYAYGDSGSPPKIPPNATLMFEIELFEWQCEDLSPHKDGGIQRRILEVGEDYINPNDGATVDGWYYMQTYITRGHWWCVLNELLGKKLSS